MKKFRLYFDKDKEEFWLNEMSREGWAMTGFVAGVYTFVPCEPGEYVYRIDMPGEIGKTPIWYKNREYIELVEETGAEYVCRWGWWMIFRKEAARGAFELYTDTESQIALYRRIRRVFLIVGMFEFSLAMQNTGNIMHFWIGRDVFRTLNSADLLLFAGLVFIYFVTVGFFYMVVKLTRKMQRLRE